jgi:hypothetical protein
MLQEVMG